MADSEKKRKRTSEGADTPSKKVATGANGARPAFASVKVKHLEDDSKALGPIVAYTPGITAPTNVSFTPYKTAQSSKTKRRQVLLQSSQHGRLDFIGQEEQAGGPLGNLKHYVGVYDPAAGSFTMTECHKVTMRSSLRPTQEELDEEANLLKERGTRVEQRNELGQEFGTKKAKKKIADYTVNSIQSRRAPGETAPMVDAVQAAILENLNVKTEAMVSKEQLEEEINAGKPRPKLNPNATKPAEVYALDLLVQEEDLNAMRVEDWRNTSKNKELKSRFVAKRVNRVATGKGSDKALKVLKYLYTLITWFTSLSGSRDGKRLPPRDKLKDKVDAPTSVLESIRRQYCQGSTVNKWGADKVVLTICALALHVDNFSTSINDLFFDLQMEEVIMVKLFQELGCKILSRSDGKVAQLQLPLEFPQDRPRRGPKR